MQIKIITIHAMHNPGSVFQAYALQEYLKENETNKVEIIDYRPNYFYNEGNKLKLLIKKIVYRKSYNSRNKKFINFIEDNMKLTKTYETYEELEKANLLANFFIVGSDQLWNTDFPCGNDLAFYLKFVKEGTKISYSTSVGKKYIDEHNKEILMNNLSDFKSISVREKSTSITLEKLFNKQVTWVCDPVFLLSKEKYMQFIDASNPIFDNKYVAVYLAPESKILDSIIEHYKRKGYSIVLVGGVTKRCKCDKHIADVGPEDFLNLIYHAEAIVSTSFHATAFCHIFHKEFITILPKKNGERITSLLSQTDLLNRGIEEKINFNEIEQPIVWEYVDERLNKYIDNSRKYLKNALKNE